jgi:hypothetical protein
VGSVLGGWGRAAVLALGPCDRCPTAGRNRSDQASEPLRFDGWLELLRVVSELVAAAPSSGENADTAAEPPRGARLDPAEPGSPKDRGTEEGGRCASG